MMNEPTELVIPVGLAQAIADYLSTRPFREVAGMMQALQNLKPVEQPQQPEYIGKHDDQ